MAKKTQIAAKPTVAQTAQAIAKTRQELVKAQNDAQTALSNFNRAAQQVEFIDTQLQAMEDTPAQNYNYYNAMFYGRNVGLNMAAFDAEIRAIVKTHLERMKLEAQKTLVASARS